MKGSYDDPDFTLLREVVVPAPAAGAAGATKFALYAAAVLTRARAVVKTAGTSANTGSYLQVLAGTATAGVLLTGSQTAGAVVDISLGNTVLPAGTVGTILQGTDATGAVYGVTLEYRDQVS